MSGGVTTTSDDLGQLSERRLRLFKLILPESKTPCRFPRLGQAEITYSIDPCQPGQVITRQQDPIVVQVRPVSGGNVLFLLNTGEQPVTCTYSTGSPGLDEPAYVWEWGVVDNSPLPVNSLEITLAPHSGRLFWLTEQPLAAQPERLR
jgi:hypothetical protein